MSKELLSPKSDFIFKLIFGDRNNRDILIDFLQSVIKIPPEEYERITIIDPHLRKTNVNDKLSILDVRLQTKNGREIEIDIQVLNVAGMKERIVHYVSKMITEQISEGEDYDKIQQVISIVITDFELVKDSGEYHNGYVLYDPQSGSVFSNMIEIHTLELPKVKKRLDGTKLREWLSFFNAESEEEYTVLAEHNPKIGKAVAVLKRLSNDERTRMLAEAREKARRDERGRLKFRYEEGRQEGMQEGQNYVLNLLDQGYSPEEIKRQLKAGNGGQ